MLQRKVMCLSSLFKRIAQEELLFCCSELFRGWELGCQQSEALHFMCRKFIKLNECTHSGRFALPSVRVNCFSSNMVVVRAASEERTKDQQPSWKVPVPLGLCWSRMVFVGLASNEMVNCDEVTTHLKKNMWKITGLKHQWALTRGESWSPWFFHY